MKEKLIPGIYNYCDRWCERCHMTHACRVFQTEQAAIASNPAIKDSDSPDFWQFISDQFAKAAEMLYQEAERLGIDLDNLPEQELPDRESVRKKQDTIPSIRLAGQYWRQAKDWLDTNRQQLQDHALQQFELNIPGAEAHLDNLGDALEVIQWYLFQIEVKLRRAYDSLTFLSKLTKQHDSNGSAKVALIAMERSIGAWSILYEALPQQQNELLNFMALLQKTRRKTLEEFPNAPAFKRPGFDE